MTIYIVISDPPQEFGGRMIWAGFKSKSKAKIYMINCKKRDAYSHQYDTIISLRIR